MKKNTKITKPFIWCGSTLENSGIERGDNLVEIIEKLNDSLSNEGHIYTFEDNEECDNGGFKVFQDGEEIYSFCYECCSNFNVVNYEESKGAIAINEQEDVILEGGVSPSLFSTDISYVVTALDGDGEYDVQFQSPVLMSNGVDFYLGVHVNNIAEELGKQSHYSLTTSSTDTLEITQTCTTFKSKIFLNVGDEVGICVSKDDVPFIDGSKFKVTKI